MFDLYVCGGGYYYEKGFFFLELNNRLKRNEKFWKSVFSNVLVIFVLILEFVKEKVEVSLFILKFLKQVIYNGLDFFIWKLIDVIEV